MKELKKKKFIIYGLGVSGISVIKFFKKKRVKNFKLWDDNKKIRKKFHLNKKIYQKDFDACDYVVISPGINYRKTKFRNFLKKNFKKIITDIDLLYLYYKKLNSIVITGTNGKSTTCKILNHILKKKYRTVLGGNIGEPILNQRITKDTLCIIEASSYQLFYSKYIKPKYAVFLNFDKDHLDWHLNLKEYLDAKMKIFKYQDNKDFAFIKNSKIKLIFKKKKYKSQLIKFKKRPFLKLKSKISNKLLLTSANLENLSNIIFILEKFKIKESYLINSINKFKGLEHRQEKFLKKKNIEFINDSKATSFISTMHALKSYKNIFWILGGLPKKKDLIRIDQFSKIILKCFIVGKHSNYFVNFIKNKLNYKVCFNLNNAIKQAILSALEQDKQVTILLSPSAASYDQFQNFAHRGLQFKKLCKKYANKLI